MVIHPVYNMQPVRGPGRVGARGRRLKHTYTHVSTASVRPRWRKGGKEGGREEGGRWRFHGLFRAHTFNHVRAFARFSTYFREPGDFDEWSGGMYRRSGKKIRGAKTRDTDNVANGGVWRTRDLTLARRVTGAADVKGLLRSERANEVGNHWTFCQRCLIFRKSFARTPHCWRKTDDARGREESERERENAGGCWQEEAGKPDGRSEREREREKARG